MKAYRCFVFNDANHIIGVEAETCDSDDQARQWAAGRLGEWQSSRIELWDGARKVATLGPLRETRDTTVMAVATAT